MKFILKRQFLTENFLFLKIPSFLIVMLPIFMVSGSFLTDFVVSSCAILFLLNSFKNKLYNYYKNKLFLIIFIFNLVCIISSLLSSDILFSLKTSIFYFRFLIFSLCVWYVVEKNIYILNQLFYSFCFIFIALFIDSMFQFYSGTNLLGYEYTLGRVSSFFGDELVMGSFITRVLPIFLAVGYYVVDKNFLNKNIIYLIKVIFILNGILILLAGERTAFFLFILSSVFIVFFNYSKFKNLFISSILFLTIFIFFNPDSVQRIYKSTIFQITNYQYNSDEFKDKNLRKIIKDLKFFSQLHEEHYLVSYKIFKDNKIFGSGPKTFRLECKDPKYYVSKYSCSTHPHGTYFQILAETGLLGFSILTLLFIILISYSIKKIFNKNNSIFEICLLSCFLMTLWPIIPSGNFFNNWISSIYFMPLGLFFWHIHKSKI